MYCCGNVVEFVSVEKRSNSFTTLKRISKNEYVNTVTGEVKEYHSQTQTRSNSKSLKNSFIALRRLINCNFSASISELMIVLTYSEVITDPERLYYDFKRFWPKMQYHYGPLSYIAVIEPQNTGSWHIHLLVKRNDKKKLYIPKSNIDKLWGHGFTFVERIKNANNLGAYLCSYFTNVDLLENANFSKSSESKMIIKNGRLHFYPPNFKIYRCSRDIKRVHPVSMTYSEVEELVHCRTPTYQSIKRIIQTENDGSEKEVNSIIYRQYNKVNLNEH